jgi:hypothetical protein
MMPERDVITPLSAVAGSRLGFAFVGLGRLESGTGDCDCGVSGWATAACALSFMTLSLDCCCGWLSDCLGALIGRIVALQVI